MKKISLETTIGTLIVLLGILCGENCGPSGQGMIARSYPEGFSLKHPEHWQIQVKDGNVIFGSAAEEESDSSFILVTPFFLGQRMKSAEWIRQNMPSLGKFFTDVAFEKMEQTRDLPDELLAKIRFQRDNKSCRGMALCSIHESSGILYVMGASDEEFDSKKTRLVDILESFRFEEPTGEKPKAADLQIAYIPWRDPIENAFSLDVPRGWIVGGGSYRRASVDLVHSLHASSPDNKMRIQFNDRDIPAFTVPSPMLSMAGFIEGSWYSPGYGVRMLVKRYTPGQYFLKEYLQSHYAPHLNGFEMVSQNNRQDVASAFNRIYSQFGTYGISFTMDAGDAAFRFVQDSEVSVGYGLALTQIVQSMGMQGGTWSVPLLLIFTCLSEKSELVHQISDHMFKSVKVNPQWAASQQQLAANVSQIVTQTNQEISAIINNSYWSRQRTMDDIHRRFSNYILGMTDVVDPATGEKWNVEAGHNYYWRKDYTSEITGTEVYERPDIDFSPLREF